MIPDPSIITEAEKLKKCKSQLIKPSIDLTELAEQLEHQFQFVDKLLETYDRYDDRDDIDSKVCTRMLKTADIFKVLVHGTFNGRIFKEEFDSYLYLLKDAINKAAGGVRCSSISAGMDLDLRELVVTLNLSFRHEFYEESRIAVAMGDIKFNKHDPT